MKKSLILIALLLAAFTINAQESNVIHITKAEFIEKVYDYTASDKAEWQYKGDKPAIIDFYADWCGPCRKLSPILEEVATEFKKDIYIYKVNTDKEPEIAKAFGIRALPTIYFIPMNGDMKGYAGFLPKEELVKAINSVLLKKEEENKE